jgi:peptidoglycan/LPS O-acetylase OafA/YrhL
MTSKPSAPTTSERLYSIDALRGVAALCVVVFHLKVMTAHPGGALGMSNAFGRWGNDYLWTAVDLFFLISGFIFAHVYLRDGALTAGTTARDYVVARVARIYPLHLLTLGVVAVIVWAGAPLTPSFDRSAVSYDGYHFVLNLLMLQASGIEKGFSFNSPAWSLTSEFVCYALFFILARAGGRWLVAGALLLIAIGIGAELGWLPVPSRIARGLVGFFLGVLLNRHRSMLLTIPFIVLVGLSILSMLLAPQLAGTRINAGVVMSLIAWPWLVLVCLHPASHRFLGSRVMQFFGDLSYSSYLLHIPLGLIFLTLNGGQYFDIGQFYWLVPVYMGTLILVSWASFRWFETPARRWIRKIASLKKQRLQSA